MTEFNDRRPTRPSFFEPKPYFPQRGSDKGPSMGVQGKLFRDPKPVDSVRYPRGYTPERMAEVKAMPIHVQSGQWPGKTPAKNVPFQGPGGAHRALQVIARSTTPADQVQKWHDSDLHIHTASSEVGRNAYAHYTYTPQAGYGAIHLGRSSDEIQQGQSLLHEMGHAHSEMTGTPHTRPDTRRKIGQEEAYADDNMMRHWRPDPRDVRKGKNRDPQTAYEEPNVFKRVKVPLSWQSGRGNQTGGVTAERAYHAARQTPNAREKKTKEWQARNADASAQLPMLIRYGREAEQPGPWAQAESLHPMQFGKLGPQ